MRMKNEKFRCPVCGWEGTSSEVIWDSGESDDDWWDIESCPRCFEDGFTFNWVKEIKDEAE
jgi:RNA polymerase subunit RPABC4/transcription elongation factor Spt4